MNRKASPGFDFSGIRRGMSELPRASRHEPWAQVNPAAVYTPDSHRGAVDLERPLVIGNRGAGKSFWAHALLNKEVRDRVAQIYRQPSLKNCDVVIGFNGAEKLNPIAPSPELIEDAIKNKYSPEIVWRAVLARALAKYAGIKIPERFVNVLRWVKADTERYQSLLSKADDNLAQKNRRLIIVFDALDRLPGSWSQIREITRALMQRTLAIKSFTSIRFKVFMRPDQFTDEGLFKFPDGSKIVNDRVTLRWAPTDLYGLLFHELERRDASQSGLKAAGTLATGGGVSALAQDEQEKLINLIAGPFMGSDRRRGRVYTWVPTHLADALGDCSPRTFLTAWRVAAEHRPAPKDRAVDHLGINEGVRQASSDRLQELGEDYPWVKTVLEPLRDYSVPMEQSELEKIWRKAKTVEKVVARATAESWLAPIEIELANPSSDVESALIQALETIGVIQVRDNGKINVPDIFRVEAGIKRKGGVAVPRKKRS